MKFLNLHRTAKPHRRFSLPPPANHFTGKERDSESGNDYFVTQWDGSAS